MVAQPTPNPDPLDPRMVEILRRKTGAERFAIASGMFAMARDIVTASVRNRHPNWSDDQIRREVVRRLSHGAV